MMKNIRDTEADTCRKYVLPKLYDAGWKDDQKRKRRLLITMATGSGKTYVSFQIIWKLWNSRWNRTGEYRRSKILYLSDRNILVDVPKDKDFAAFGDARHKIEGEIVRLFRGEDNLRSAVSNLQNLIYS